MLFRIHLSSQVTNLTPEYVVVNLAGSMVQVGLRAIIPWEALAWEEHISRKVH